MGAFLSLINPISTILDRVLPDKSAAAAAKAQLVQLEANGELQTILGQIDIDKAEAGSSNKYAADWRPTMGYILAAAFGYTFILQPLLQFSLVAFKVNFDVTQLPKLDMSTLMPITLGMLGLAGAHAWESVNTASK